MNEFEANQGTTLTQEDADIAAFVESWRASGERPEAFWTAQRTAIHQRIQGAEQHGSLPLAWAASAALLTLAAGLLMQVPAPASAMVTYDPDHDLLVGVEQAVRRPVPEALEPAQLLVSELESSVQAVRRSDPRQKVAP
jgi:hypothetical protein